MRAGVLILTLLTTTTAPAHAWYGQNAIDDGRMMLTETWDESLTVVSPATWGDPIGNYNPGVRFNQWGVRFEGVGEYVARFDLTDPIAHGKARNARFWLDGDITLYVDGVEAQFGVNYFEPPWSANEYVEFRVQVEGDGINGNRCIGFAFGSVPEPSTAALLLISALMPMRRRFR